MKKMTKQEAGRLGAKASHKRRYELLLILSSKVSKSVLDNFQKKWSTDQLEELVKLARYN